MKALLINTNIPVVLSVYGYFLEARPTVTDIFGERSPNDPSLSRPTVGLGRSQANWRRLVLELSWAETQVRSWNGPGANVCRLRPPERCLGRSQSSKLVLRSQDRRGTGDGHGPGHLQTRPGPKRENVLRPLGPLCDGPKDDVFSLTNSPYLVPINQPHISKRNIISVISNTCSKHHEDTLK